VKKIAVEDVAPQAEVKNHSTSKRSGRAVEVSIEIDNNSGLIVTPNSSNGVLKL